ncbi:putative immunity protein [Deinococcus sp.]|uniref:putative immunity protein n=1 Tax=Deinococcus sp. TaxID=47478 RepID=UPI003CC647D1
MSTAIKLSEDEVREVARYASQSVREVLDIFEIVHPGDLRPRAAVEAAWAFAQGSRRSNLLRDTAWEAMRAAQASTNDAAQNAARSAMCAASAAYLHPIAKATQVRHILGAAAYAARACELNAGEQRSIAEQSIERARLVASPVLREVLNRYPPAPAGGGRVGELLRLLDDGLRQKD